MRKSSIGACLLVVGVMLALPIVAYAQQAALDAALIGTVRDATRAVLPGVTVVAQNEATGNTFEAVTDAVGAYRIPVRVGSYQVTAQLPSFRTVVRTGLQVLVGAEVVTEDIHKVFAR